MSKSKDFAIDFNINGNQNAVFTSNSQKEKQIREINLANALKRKKKLVRRKI